MTVSGYAPTRCGAPIAGNRRSTSAEGWRSAAGDAVEDEAGGSEVMDALQAVRLNAKIIRIDRNFILVVSFSPDRDAGIPGKFPPNLLRES